MNDQALHAPTSQDRPVATEDGHGVPEVASARRYLRDAVPSIYRTKDSFAMRLLHALERVLDPRVAILDSLSAYLAPELAPDGMVDEMAGWLGLELGDARPGAPRRELLAHAERISRRRGTRAGLQLILQAAFPDLGLRVEDRGGTVVRSAEDTGAPEPNPGFIVWCPWALSPSERDAVERTIALELPLHVEGTLVNGLRPREATR